MNPWWQLGGGHHLHQQYKTGAATKKGALDGLTSTTDGDDGGDHSDAHVVGEDGSHSDTSVGVEDASSGHRKRPRDEASDVDVEKAKALGAQW